MTVSVEIQPHVLYRFYDVYGSLLYVGITRNLGSRWRSHNKDKPWWKDVVSASVEHFDSEDDAADAEYRAIRTERPVWNIRHRPTRPVECGSLPDRSEMARAAAELEPVAKDYADAVAERDELRPRLYAGIYEYKQAHGDRRGWQTELVRLTGLTREHIRVVILAEERRRAQP
jgi:predicted GIY-YIG superfamily endonuclease